MRAWLRVLTLVAAGTLAGPVPIAAGHGAAAPLTVTGEILDLACYVAHGGQGPQHAKCALKCARQGQPIGLLAADGTVYVLFADHADATAFNKAKELAGRKAEIRGEAAARDGVKGLTVHAVEPL
jgi:hypothetical protein